MTVARERSPDFDISGADVPRDLFPPKRDDQVPRVKFSLALGPDVKNRKAETTRRREQLNRLRVWGAWDVYRAIVDGSLHVGHVCAEVSKHGEAALAKLRQRFTVGTCPTVRKEADAYLEEYATNGSEQSYHTRRSQLLRLADYQLDGAKLGEYAIDAVSRKEIVAAIQAVGGARANTQEGYRAAASALWHWSVKEERDRARVTKRAPRWTENPLAEVKRGGGEVRVETASEEQVLALIAAAEPYQLAYLRAYVHLGLRQMELVHTRLHADLDTDTWLWRIQARAPDPRCPCRRCCGRGWKPKTRRGQRDIIVPELDAAGGELLRSAIAEYLDLYPATEGDFVFRNPRTDEVWNALSLARDFAALCERAEVRYGRDVPGGITIHALRHTAATSLVRAGVRESVIARLLGDDVQTVVRVYVNLTPEDVAAGIRQGPRYA